MIKNGNTRHLKIAIATLALATLGFTGAHAQADAADEMVNPTDKVLVGYWHNWKSTGKDGLQAISGLKAATTYTVEVVAINNAGIRSDSASTTFSTTGGTVTPENTWSKDKEYWTSDRVYYNGKEYEAKWWTKGDQPNLSGPYGPWKEI
ncbi:carbohydrate-binding protein [Lactococcus petauri]|uniref:Carbohydrate-binding protein n=1 Tax=Lactococcus petauri TaxID=1940789 RepID=A0AAJ2IZF2_9LACT|nr:carbohydrate-binding protein [Lactococcus petauri]MDT2527206.1 carbohydrate-binding protein [Lactococcus petauri]MDT2541679.1 carbohydrate-binding protein [Lactococcus petauri]MDT2558290.1 carbohydrate-binding protein [Lactococcus petauri]MDT2560387.1 carbohydrate-binding protein [Lactococcus petauri]MDT2569031.1 carbohydrate-binding protein [Lactococcus petauri]